MSSETRVVRTCSRCGETAEDNGDGSMTITMGRLLSGGHCPECEEHSRLTMESVGRRAAERINAAFMSQAFSLIQKEVE